MEYYMPTYEYRCKNCKFEFEEFQSIASEPLHVCPKCNGNVERKISGGSGLIFKGSGFYITDYKNNKLANDKPTTKSKEIDKPKTKVS
jgi:putative FmdB family regulatory protein